MFKTLIAAAFVLAVATPAFAQVPTITGIRIDLARISTPTVVAGSTIIPIAQPTCNLAPTTLPPVTVNPLQVEWTDPALPLRVCRAAIPLTLTGLVPADYQATATFIYSDPLYIGGTSTASNPFTRFDVATPVGLKLVK
jgi:hypothetical protein